MYLNIILICIYWLFCFCIHVHLSTLCVHVGMLMYYVEEMKIISNRFLFKIELMKKNLKRNIKKTVRKLALMEKITWIVKWWNTWLVFVIENLKVKHFKDTKENYLLLMSLLKFHRAKRSWQCKSGEKHVNRTTGFLFTDFSCFWDI